MSNNDKKKIFPESLHILISRWKEGTFSEIIEDWKWILGFSAKYKGAIALYIFMGILSTSFGLASSVAGKYLIDIITGYQTDRLAILIVIMLGSSLGSIILDNTIKRTSAKISIFINNDIQAEIFDKIVDADWLSLNKFTNGDILNRFNSDISTVSNNAISWLPNIIIAVYKFVATFVVILHYDVVMALIALGSAPVMLFASKYLIKKQREFGKKVREAHSDLMTFEVETFYNFDTIKSFGIAPRYSKRMRGWQKRYRDVSLDYNLFSIKTNMLMSGMGMMVQMVAFGYCLFRLWTHDITYGTMTLFLQQRGHLSNAFQNMVSIIPTFLDSSVAAHRIRELVELPKEVHIPESKELAALAEDGYSIQLNDISFAYLENQKVIEDTDFVANPGEIVALVGPSGEGKTTMLRIILGLIHPQDGVAKMVASNGKEVKLNVETRRLFSYVPQGNTILSGTIAENIRMVKEEASDEEVTQALKMACAWDFVEKMPQGIYSSVGERGKGLSEGQAQRVAIARAILKDAPVLLLDEATSALDVATERQVLKNIVEQKPNKTCIVTTHRPSVLNLCKRVYRISGKKGVELTEEEAGKIAMDF